MEITITARSTSKTGKSMWVSFKTMDLQTETTKMDGIALRIHNQNFYDETFNGMYKDVEREVDIVMTAEDIKNIVDFAVKHGVISFSTKISTPSRSAPTKRQAR